MSESTRIPEGQDVSVPEEFSDELFRNGLKLRPRAMGSFFMALPDNGDNEPEGPVLNLLAISETLAWQDLANCREADPDLFFPGRGASTRVAKAICRECTVRDDCLEFAVTANEKFGIWGEMSERDRRRIRRQRAAVPKESKDKEQ